MMFCKASKVAFARLGAFVKQVTNRDFSKRTVSSRIDLDHDGRFKSEVLLKDSACGDNVGKVGSEVLLKDSAGGEIAREIDSEVKNAAVSETSAWDLLSDPSTQSDQSLDGFGFDIYQITGVTAGNIDGSEKSDGATIT